MNKFAKIIFFTIFLVGNFYLLLPPPAELPPLPESLRSDEPGDTVQIKGVSAYYTDLSRKEVVDFYSQTFSKSSFFNIPLISYRINHPPEKIREVLRTTQFSTYVEEVVHPLRGSLFINGYEWNNDPFTLPEQRNKNIIIVNGKTYRFKITLYLQYSSAWPRVLIWSGINIAMYLIFVSFQKILQKGFNLSKASHAKQR